MWDKIPPFKSFTSLKEWHLLFYMFFCFLIFCSCESTHTITTLKSNTTRSTPATPTDLLTPHVLTVGSYVDYVPQEFYDSTTYQPVGFDIDLIKEIARRLGLQVTIVDSDFPQLIDRLSTRQFDVAISAISIVPELQQKARFVSYFRGGESLLAQKGNPHHLNSLDQLCGQKVAVKDQSFEDNDLIAVSKTCQKKGQAAITIITRSALSETVQLLATGAVAATYQNAAQSDYFILQYPKLFEVAGTIVDQNIEGIAVRKDNTAMLSAIQATFQSLVDDGSYQTIIKRWGLISGDITKPAVSTP